MRSQPKFRKHQPKREVGRYFQEKAKIDSQKPVVSKVAKYLAQQVIRESLKPSQSGVARYLTKSRVYTARPVVSGVAKYLETQALVAKTKPEFSGVAKYLIKQRLSAPSKTTKASGVTQYLAQYTQVVGENAAAVKKPVKQKFEITGVAQYLSRQSEAVDVLVSQADVPVEICLEGEFIPAAEALESP